MNRLKVEKPYIKHGLHNEKKLDGYTLEDGTELADWLALRTARGSGKAAGLLLHMGDYMDAQMGRREDCRAYIRSGDGFCLVGVVLLAGMTARELHTGRTPLQLPEHATPFVSNHGDMIGWYDRGSENGGNAKCGTPTPGH